MRVAVLGVGCIGSVVAAHLARAGHDVSLVARGARHRALLEHGLQLRQHGSRKLERMALPVADDLRKVADAELVVVTVQMQQVAALLPALREHAAAHVCMLLNVNPVPESWKEALGARLVLGFPAMLAGYREALVAYRTLPGWMRFAMISTLGPPVGGDLAPARALAKLFSEARLATTYERDMESWLATHSALVTGLSAFASGRVARGQSLRMSWGDAFTVARALSEALALVKASGARLTPTNIAALTLSPAAATASVLWTLSRTPWFEQAVVDYAEHGAEEVRAMYEGLRARAPGVSAPNLTRLCVPPSGRVGESNDHERSNQEARVG